MNKWQAIIGTIVVLVVVLLFTAFAKPGWARSGGGEAESTPTATSIPGGPSGEREVVITQDGQSHTLPLELLFQLEGQAIPCFVLKGDTPAQMTVRYGDSNVKFEFTQSRYTDQPEITSVTTDTKGEASFDLELPLQDRGFGAAKFTLALFGQNGRSAAQFEIALIKGIESGGLTGGDMINSCGELIDMVSRLGGSSSLTPTITAGGPTPTSTTGTGSITTQPVVTTAGVRVNQLFLDAFTQYCGFSPSDLDPVTPVSMDPTTELVPQVAWNGTSFVQSRNFVPVGQYVLTLHATGGRTCVINPPCGNPKVEEGKLPLAPPELQPTPPPGQVLTATPTPTPPPTCVSCVTATPTNTPVCTPTPTNTPTPTGTVPATLTPTNTPPVTATSTPGTPTNTPVTPTGTPFVPTPTPTQPPLTIFGCPDFQEHGSQDFTRVGIAVANRPVDWNVSGGTVLAKTDTSVTIQAAEGAHVVVSAKPSGGVWITACDRWVPVSQSGATPIPTMMPPPTSTPGGPPQPTPIATPIPPP